MPWIKKTYLYVVSLIALIILVIGAITLLNIALKQWVFTQADMPYRMVAQCPFPDSSGEKTSVECNEEYLEKQQEYEKENRAAERQRDASRSIAMIIVAAPIFWLHWRLAREEK